MVDCVGALGGSHIPTVCPGRRAEGYLSCKRYLSAVAQVGVDSRAMFLDVFANVPHR